MDSTPKSGSIVLSVFFFFGPKIRPRKYDFNLYKGFSMKEMAKIRQSLKKKVSRSLDFDDKFE
jgi:hypothetical protein